MRRAAIIDAVRTPVGRYGGCLATVRPDDLAAMVIKAVVERTSIDPDLIDDVYFGAANQAGEDNRNVARMAALLAGLPASVPGCTVNRLCASGLEAMNLAARMIEADHGDVFIVGGTESMSRAPFAMAKSETAFARTPEVYDTTIGWRFTNARLAELYHPYSMGGTAENVARTYGVSREDQDAFALESQTRWAAAKRACRFDREIVEVEAPILGEDGEPTGDTRVVSKDQGPRDTTAEGLAGLKPIEEGGIHTAGNSSQISDGAAAVLWASEEKAQELGSRRREVEEKRGQVGLTKWG